MDVDVIVTYLPIGSRVQDGAMRGEAVAWFAEQRALHERRENRRYLAMVILTFIAALAACIAVWPILKGWFSP